MRISFLISGAPRTIVYKSQLQNIHDYINFLKQSHTVDVYILFKLNDFTPKHLGSDRDVKRNYIQSDIGIDMITKIKTVLNPITFIIISEIT